MKLRKVGFFVELPHGDPEGGSLQDAVRTQGERDKRKMVSYLRKGVVLYACPGIGQDVLDASAGAIEPPDILTDGVWAWPADLAYYLKKYNVELPADFLAHVRGQRYRPPRPKEIGIDDLEL